MKKTWLDGLGFYGDEPIETMPCPRCDVTEVDILDEDHASDPDGPGAVGYYCGECDARFWIRWAEVNEPLGAGRRTE